MRHLLTALALAGCAGSAQAIPVTSTFNLDFSAPTQNFWGPGQSAASFDFDKFILGNSSFGIRFETGASTGTVSATYNGALSVSYDDLVQAGTVGIDLGFVGDASGGSFSTSLGAFAKATAYFPVIGDVTITNPNYSLATSSTYTPSPLDSPSDSDSFAPAAATIGPNIGVGSAQAGIDFSIVQNSTHSIDAVNGLVFATHQDSGEIRSATFSLSAVDSILLDLDLIGIWDVQILDLSLDNTFFTDFDLSFDPFIQYTLGAGCGDAGTNSDNGFFCIDDGRLDTTLATVDLFSNTPFALAMNTSTTLSTFQIAVVPEPETYALFLAGLGLTGWMARRRRLPA
jgi:hypothetical protein